MRLLWEESAWEQYCDWQIRDKKLIDLMKNCLYFCY